MRIFLTHILPESLIKQYGLSFAACNFSRNLMSGGGFDKVYTTMPSFVKGELEIKDVECELIYSKYRLKVGRFFKFATFLEQWEVFNRLPKHSHLWFYNISILNAFLYLLIRLFKPRVKIFVIVLDFAPPTSKYSKRSFFLWLINKADGVIKLSESPLFTNKNSLCLPGVTPKLLKQPPILSQPNFDFLLSGVLHPDISSIPMILEAFSQCPQCKLHITGKWDDMPLMDDYTTQNSNIVYHGILNNEDYNHLLHNVTFVLSLRNPKWADNQCNFPSKIIEALLHNRIVLSTIQYKQLGGIRYIKTERSVEAFVETLQQITQMSTPAILDYANQGQIVSEVFSVSVWNDSMKMIENS